MKNALNGSMPARRLAKGNCQFHKALTISAFIRGKIHNRYPRQSRLPAEITAAGMRFGQASCLNG